MPLVLHFGVGQAPHPRACRGYAAARRAHNERRREVHQTGDGGGKTEDKKGAGPVAGLGPVPIRDLRGGPEWEGRLWA